MIEARNISVTIGAKKLLDRVSLTVAPGAVIAVVGANGAGKSTLLKALSGDLKLAAGEILVDQRPLSQWNHYELARRRAVLPQQSNVNNGFTAFEVVLLGRNPHLSVRESRRDREIANEALRAVAAERLAHRIFATLSGGEQQRVSLARILAQIWDEPAQNSHSRYLLLDEPVASLDLAHQHLTMQIAREFAGKNTGVLVVLHDLNLAAQYADQICLLKNSGVLASGAPAEVLTAPNIRRALDFAATILEHDNKFLIVPNMKNNILETEENFNESDYN